MQLLSMAPRDPNFLGIPTIPQQMALLFLSDSLKPKFQVGTKQNNKKRNFLLERLSLFIL